jgi:RNA polymerase sigma factor (sigma-70 family)
MSRPRSSSIGKEEGAHEPARTGLRRAGRLSMRSQPLGTEQDEAALVQWLRAVIAHDEVAFAALYRALGGRVYAQALRILRDTGCAEEIVEDVFWQVWRQAPRFDAERGSVAAWVGRIARSRALDALRALGRNPLHQAAEIDAEDVPLFDADTQDPPNQLGSARAAAQMERALCTLDPLRRQLVALAFMHGYSQAQIAEHTGLPLGTVKSHIRRALALMRISLEDAEGSRLPPEGPA